MTLYVRQFPCLSDNYGFLIRDEASGRTACIDTPDAGALTRHPRVVERVSRIVEERNGELQSYAKVKKFLILSEDFTVDNGLLTPTLKVKRKIITEQHKDQLDSLYR